jgi:HEAT repeat protein
MGISAVLVLEPLRDVVLVLAAAVVLLAGVLLVERTFGSLAGARARKREPELTRLIYDAIEQRLVIGDQLRGMGRWDRRLVRSILLELALDLRGETRESIAALYAQLGFAETDLARLHSRRASIRAAAVADLGLIHSSEAAPALSLALNDRHVSVRQAAVWALSQVGTPATLARLVRLLGDRSLVVARRAQEVLAVRGEEVAGDILAFAASTSSRMGRVAAIELIGWLRLSNAAELLLDFSDHLDPEIRVKSVKAAAAIGGPQFRTAFHSRLEDPSWPVRSQAAKGLRRCGSPESVPRLTKALRDKRWWVRFYAAAALAEFGAAGRQALTEGLTDQNAQVRDMARYLLERGELLPALP